ncbi:MAG: DUF4956 domain-containing protein [Bacteroidales bacterium]|nr:DUF4956 domain-containing protein [Candidatus Equimonas faecalis]
MEIILRYFTENVNLLNLITGTLLNTLFVWVLVHYFYFPKGRRRDYYFSFILMSISVFMLIFLLIGNDKAVGTGVALGLFAIFSIVRFRTESVPIREMTYLFILVAMSVLNGKLGSNISLVEAAPTPKDPGNTMQVALSVQYSLLIGTIYICIISLIFIAVVWVAERVLTKNYTEGCKYVKYDNIELITPDRYDDLVADLEKRLGLHILRVEVGAVDFLKDATMLRVFYADQDAKIKPVDRIFKIDTEANAASWRVHEQKPSRK